MTETFICTMCGEENPLEDCTFLDEEMLCPDCQEEHTRICDHCGNRIWLDDVYGDDDLTLCRHCRETYYETCYECGRLVEYNSVRCDVDGENVSLTGLYGDEEGNNLIIKTISGKASEAREIGLELAKLISKEYEDYEW